MVHIYPDFKKKQARRVTIIAGETKMDNSILFHLYVSESNRQECLNQRLCCSLYSSSVFSGAHGHAAYARINANWKQVALLFP